MDVLHPRCCGLDVHKSSISACILLREAGRVQKHQRRFGAMTQDLRELAEWLRQFGVSQVAMESSGVYWKPVWNILEGQFTVVLANTQQIKNVPGRKTDQKDAEWIAQLLQYGLLRASYVPCEIIRDLRDLTRMRASLSQEASRISSRIQKVLEDANLKLASVATNVLGKSGRAMLEDIITGEDHPEHLASLALGHLRVKIPQLRLALEGKIRSHHRFLLRRLLDQIQFVEHEIALLDERMEDIGRQRPDLGQAVARWDTIPGIDRVAAWALLAEIGDNMGQFPTAEHGPVGPRYAPAITKARASVCAVQLVKGAHGCAAWLVNAPGLPRELRTLTCPRSSDAWPRGAARKEPSSRWPIAS
jgi:transposase